MSTITQYYGIAGPVPFLDVELEADNRLFLDPHAIRLRDSPQPFAREALNCIDTFMQEIVALVLDGTARAHANGEALLQQFSEPWETRLGVSKRGFYGHGGAQDVGTRIWDAVSTDLEALVRVGLLRQLEDLPLFVEGLDRDITSDVTTRIIFESLARFTAATVLQFPEFTADGHEVQQFIRQVWNCKTFGWEEQAFDLPISDGQPLLLVPRGWARPSLLMSAGRFYGTTVLSFAQLERAVLGPQGKPLKTPKDRLRLLPGLERGRQTNFRVSMRALARDEDLLAEFKRFVAERFDGRSARPGPDIT